MKSAITIILAALFSSIMPASHVFGYGYKIQEDPLIKIFKAVVFHVKESDWDQISREIDAIDDRIKDIDLIFGIDLAPQLIESIDKKDVQMLIKNMANLVFLAIREKFYWNQTEGLEINMKAKVRLRLAEEYYVTLLSGNARVFDQKNRTNINDEIYQRFAEARSTLGSLGFFGVGAIRPDLEKFISITNDIEEKIIEIFPYFKR